MNETLDSMIFYKVTKILHILYDHLLTILAPPFCAYCSVYLDHRTVFCDNCHSKLEPLVSIMMPITSTKSVKVFAAVAYKEPIKTLILAKKWHDSVACVKLAHIIDQKIDLTHIPCDYLIPIPLHWTRHVRRGYNQAFEIAKALARKHDKKVVQVLKRNKRTAFQFGLNAQARLTNLDRAFALKSGDYTYLKDKHLIIIDDLMTTGATIRAAAKELYALKPASISVVVPARVSG